MAKYLTTGCRLQRTCPCNLMVESICLKRGGCWRTHPLASLRDARCGLFSRALAK